MVSLQTHKIEILSVILIEITEPSQITKKVTFLLKIDIQLTLSKESEHE